MMRLKRIFVRWFVLVFFCSCFVAVNVGWYATGKASASSGWPFTYRTRYEYAAYHYKYYFDLWALVADVVIAVFVSVGLWVANVFLRKSQQPPIRTVQTTIPAVQIPPYPQ